MSEARNSGIGLTGVLFVVFLVLRLTDRIDWAWYWIAAPLWMPLAAALVFVALCFPICALYNVYARHHNRKVLARRKAMLDELRGRR